LSQESYVSNVTSYFSTPIAGLRSIDNRSALILAHIQTDGDAPNANTQPLLKKLSSYGGHVALVQGGGETATNTALTSQVGKDLLLVSIVAVPITLILLYFVFGGIRALLLPLGVAGVAIMGTFATLKILTTFTSVSTYAIDLTIALGLGLAIDYSLLIVRRYREEVANGQQISDAIARTTATAGRTVLFSALTVALSMTALLVFPLYFLRSFAYAGIAVVAFAVLGALIVLPAMLAGAGARLSVSRRAVHPRPGDNHPTPHDGESPFWTRLAERVTARPFVVALPIVAVLVLIGTPLLNVHFSTPDERVLQSSSAPHQVGDALRTRFAGHATDALLAVADGSSITSPQTGTGPSTATMTSWKSYSVRLSSLRGVDDVQGPAGIYRDGALIQPPRADQLRTRYQDNIAYWTVDNSLDPTSSDAAQLVRDIRETPAPVGTAVQVGGRAADLMDQKHSIGSNLIWAGAIIILASFLVLFLFTGSLLIPVKALVLNGLMQFTALGAMIWIFQDGHLTGLLNFTPTPTTTTIPPLLFVIAFGLSMDYEVFLISRIKELHERGMTNRESIVRGMAKAGPMVSTAAGLLSVTFFAFGLSKISFLQFFGIGTGIAVLLDALVIRGILVPAVMQTVGDRIWWAPGPLKRLYSRVGLHEEVPDSPAQILSPIES
jgi:RND superfamily putative drug exporter